MSPDEFIHGLRVRSEAGDPGSVDLFAREHLDKVLGKCSDAQADLIGSLMRETYLIHGYMPAERPAAQPPEPACRVKSRGTAAA